MIFLYLVNLLDGVANTGTVELGDVQLAVYLAEKKSNGQPFFRNGETHLLIILVDVFLFVLSTFCRSYTFYKIVVKH